MCRIVCPRLKKEKETRPDGQDGRNEEMKKRKARKEEKKKERKSVGIKECREERKKEIFCHKTGVV